MTVTPVTPNPGLTSSVNVGGTPVNVAPANAAGGYISNSVLNTDQNISVAEWIYVDPVGPAQLGSFGTTVGIPPGGTFSLIPGSTLPVSVNAATNGHRFTVVYFEED